MLSTSHWMKDGVVAAVAIKEIGIRKESEKIRPERTTEIETTDQGTMKGLKMHIVAIRVNLLK